MEDETREIDEEESILVFDFDLRGIYSLIEEQRIAFDEIIH